MDSKYSGSLLKLVYLSFTDWSGIESLRSLPESAESESGI